MTDTNPTLASLAATLAEVSKQLEAARRALEPTLDPNDLLDEILPEEKTPYDSEPEEDNEADDVLDTLGAPRTVRNLLKAYMEREDADDVYSISLGGGWNRGTVRVMRVRRLTFTRPGHDSFYVDSTPLFPVPFGVPVSALVGFTILGEHKVLDAYEANGNSYLIVQSFPNPLEDLLDS